MQLKHQRAWKWANSLDNHQYTVIRYNFKPRLEKEKTDYYLYMMFVIVL